MKQQMSALALCLTEELLDILKDFPKDAVLQEFSMTPYPALELESYNFKFKLPNETCIRVCFDKKIGSKL